jgi:hypothetical protein
LELIAVLVVPFPLGFLLRNRTAAYIAYIALHAFVFTFQTLFLLIEWAGGSEEAFGPYPEGDSGSIWGYGAVNLVIYAIGFGLVTVGFVARSRFRGQQSREVNLDPVR